MARGDVGYSSGSLEERYGAAWSNWSKARYGHVPRELITVEDVLGGLALSIETLTDPGARILVPVPSYPPFLSLPPALGREVEPVVLEPEQGFRIDPDRLEAAARASGAQALIVCNPHNPTGVVLSAGELTAIAEVALRCNLVVIADEIHADLLRAGRQHVPFVSLDHPAVERAVSLSAATKTFNIAGLKAAHIEPGAGELSARLRRVEPHRRGVASPLGLLAAAVGWEAGGDWLTMTNERLDENIARTVEACARTAHASTTSPEGTYLLWVQVDGLAGETAAQWARRRGVVVSAGETFAPSGWTDWMRLNLATEPEVVSEIIHRLFEVEV